MWIKKLAFLIPTLICFPVSLFYLNQITSDPYFILSLDQSLLIYLIRFSISLIVFSMFFIIFVTFAYQEKLIWLSPILIAVTTLLSPIEGKSFIIIGAILSLILIVFLLKNNLASYLTFQPTKLLIPSIKNLSTLLILVTSISFYFQHQSTLSGGIKVPDSLADAAANLPQVKNVFSVDNPITQSLQNITPQELQKLRSNPTLLKQQGLDETIIDDVEKLQLEAKLSGKKVEKTDTSKVFVKALLTNQINTLVKPFQQYLPLIFTVLLFVTLKSFVSLVSIPLPLIIWLIFWVLDKTGFTKYEFEQRQIRKLIV